MEAPHRIYSSWMPYVDTPPQPRDPHYAAARLLWSFSLPFLFRYGNGFEEALLELDLPHGATLIKVAAGRLRPAAKQEDSADSNDEWSDRDSASHKLCLVPPAWEHETPLAGTLPTGWLRETPNRNLARS